MLRLACLALALATVQHNAMAQSAACNAQFVQALKTNYSNVSASTVRDALFEASCESSGSADSTALGLTAYGYGELAFSQSGMNTSQACIENNRNHFRANSRNLVYSMLPPQRCRSTQLVLRWAIAWRNAG